jgi:O-antigen/teichoic acid export membrane protein
MLLVASSISDAGLGVGMVRWTRSPTRRELSDLTGIQLAITVTLAITVGAVALQFGQGGAVTAVMILALPLTSLQSASRIMLMRGVRWELITVVDGAGTILFYTWAIGGALLGFGVWGLATGAVVRAVAGTVTIWLVSDLGLVRPTLHAPRSLMPVLSFGLRLQSAYLVIVFRDIAITFLTALIGGVAVVGIWSLARRLMEVPLVLFSSVAKVLFPTMAHALASGEPPAPMVERVARVVTVVAALTLTIFAGAAPPLVPLAFGDAWAEVGQVIPWASVAVLITSSVSVGVAAYLQADDRPQDVLRAAFTNAIPWLVATPLLIPVAGAAAVGMGWVLGAAVEAAFLARYAHRACGARILHEVAAPLSTGIAGCAAGGGLSLLLEPGARSATLGTCLGMTVTAGGLALVNYAVLCEGLGQLRNVVRRLRPVTI